MRICVLVSLIFFFHLSYSQKPLYDQYRTDTIYLEKIYFKKVVSYKIGSIIFLVDYSDFKDNLYSFWKKYQKENRLAEKEKHNGVVVNPAYEPRWRLIDSVYKIIKTQIKTQDTIFLSQEIFDKVGIGPWGNFFPDLIEQNECAIFDENQKQHFTIVRQTGTKIRGPLDGYGGRAYFLPGQKQYFIAALDWIS